MSEARKSDLVDIDMTLHHVSERAILVSDDGDHDHAVWLPLSQIEYEHAAGSGIVKVTIPEWLLIERGLA